MSKEEKKIRGIKAAWRSIENLQDNLLFAHKEAILLENGMAEILILQLITDVANIRDRFLAIDRANG